MGLLWEAEQTCTNDLVNPAEPSVKLWRLDHQNNPLSLGRANDASDPQVNAVTLARHSYLDQHQMKLEKPSNGYAFHSGVKILWAEVGAPPVQASYRALPTSLASDQLTMQGPR